MHNQFGVDLCLFEKCNLNCAHCFQRHEDDSVSLDYLNSVPTKLLEIVSREIREMEGRTNAKVDSVKLSFRGGELFQDELGDEFIEAYYNIFKVMKDNIGLPTYCDFMTNGVFEMRKRVLDLVKRCYGMLSLSYDPVGRFNMGQERVFFDTFDYFVNLDKIVDISIMLTKPNIEYYKRNIDAIKVFNRNFVTIDFNHYLLNKNHWKLRISDDDFYGLLKLLVDNDIFTCRTISKIAENLTSSAQVSKFCNCSNRIMYLGGNVAYNCMNLMNGHNVQRSEWNEDSLETVSRFIRDGMNKRGCVFCENYGKCEMYCWAMYHSGYYEESSICPYKRIYDYISSNQGFLERWKEFMEIERNRDKSSEQ